MSDPIHVDPSQFFEFISRPGLVVVFVPFHPAQPFNHSLPHLLRGPEGERVPVGRVTLVELILARSPALLFLQQGLRDCGIQKPLEVLPGYYLFFNGHMVTWESGFPTTAELDSIAGASILGLIGYVFTRNPWVFAQALRMGTKEATAKRVSRAFHQAAESFKAAPPPPRPPPGPIGDLGWAYRVLGVDPSASDREVNAAWRRQQARMHPDLAAGDPAEFERRTKVTAELNRAREMIREHRARFRPRGDAPRASA